MDGASSVALVDAMSPGGKRILVLGLYPEKMTRLRKAVRSLGKENIVRVGSIPGLLQPLMRNSVTRCVAWWVASCWEAARFRPVMIYHFNIPEVLAPGVIWAKKISGATLVLDVRSAWIPILLDRGAGSVLIALGRRLEALLFAHADHLTAPNETLRAYALRGGVRSSVEYLRIPNYADENIFNNKVSGYPKSRPVVAFSGSLFSKEGVDLLIQAMEEVRWADLWIFGDGPERGNLERIAASTLGTRAVFWGHIGQNELVRHLASADVCVIPLRRSAATEYSTPESVLKFGEYASLGCKIVATKVGGMSHTGAFSAEPTPEDLARALSEALASPARIQFWRFRWGRREGAMLSFFRELQSEE